MLAFSLAGLGIDPATISALSPAVAAPTAGPPPGISCGAGATWNGQACSCPVGTTKDPVSGACHTALSASTLAALKASGALTNKVKSSFTQQVVSLPPQAMPGTTSASGGITLPGGVPLPAFPLPAATVVGLSPMTKNILILLGIGGGLYLLKRML